MIFNGAEGSGYTSRVALASICLDSIKAEFALLVQLRSKFDLGDKLVCPSLASVSKVFNGVNLAAQWGINLDGSNSSCVNLYLRNARCFSGLTKFTIASTAVGEGGMPSGQTW